MAESNALPAGHALQEYRIEKVLGVGGFALTYLATDANLNLKVAVKEFLPDDVAARGADHTVTARSAQAADMFAWGKQRFLDESRTVASLRHPNIVRVLRFFEANGTAYMVMEFVEGATLGDWVKTRRPLPEAQIAALVAPLLDGLELVHAAGYLHRDIKPGNIYVREDGSPVLIDFGSARRRSGDLTTIVSPGFAPFEQYLADGNQGPWSDIYALGGVLYWLVTGQRPHEAAARVRIDAMPPARQAGDPKLYRPAFLAAIDWALSPTETDRPQSASEWGAALLGGRERTQPVTGRAQPGAEPTLVVPRAQTASRPPSGGLNIDPALLGKMQAALAQHLGPIAAVVLKNAAKRAASAGELIAALAQEIPEEDAKIAFLKKFSDFSRPVSQPLSSPRSDPSTARAAARFPLEILANAEQHLAQYLGAVARVVVKRAAVKARDEADLYRLLAEEIEDPAERKAFTRKVSSAKKP